MTTAQFNGFRDKIAHLWTVINRTEEQAKLLQLWYEEAGAADESKHWDERMTQCNIWWKERINK